MGRIIAKRIRGMNWMAKVSLVLIFTLVFSTFMYQGLWKPRIEKAEAASGDVILLWDTANGAVPAGWTNISGLVGDPFYGVFPRAASTYGAATAGSDTHTDHTLTYSTSTGPSATLATGEAAGTAIPGSTHTHTWGAPTVGNGDVRPPFKNLVFIKANNPALIPINAIAVFDGSLPAGFTRYATLDGVYLRGFSDNLTGGAATHTHTASVTSSGDPTLQIADTANNTSNPTATHTHSVSSSLSTAANNNPLYVDVIFAYNSSGADISIPSGLIAFFDATPTGNWITVSNAAPWTGNFLRGSATFGATGGSSAAHGHGASQAFTSGAPSLANAKVVSGATNNASDAAHTHNVTYTIGTSSSTLPVYRDVIFAKYTPPAATTTLSTGTNPGNSTIAPGGAITSVNGFTLTTSAGTDAITAITVNLSTNSGVGTLTITDGADSVLGSIGGGIGTGIVTGDNLISITSTNATTGGTAFKVKVTPLSHANMPAPAGGAYGITGVVNNWTGTNTKAGQATDTSSTVTIDNASPAGTTGASATSGESTQSTVSWTNPGDADFQQIYLYCKTSTMISGEAPSEGADPAVDGTACDGTARLKYKGTASPQIISSLTNGTLYYFRIYGRDTNGNFTAYAATQEVSGTPAAAANGTLQFTAATFSVTEDAGPASATVSRTGGSSGAVSVDCATVAGGTATAGTDYTSTNTTLNWADGDTANKTCSIPITIDTADETNETVNLQLSNATGGATIGAQSTATLTINDDDPTPSLSINDVTLAEGNSGTTTFAFTVTLSAASGLTVTVDYATANGTATTADSDYTGIGATTLTYTPGQTTKTVNVLVNGDTTDEPSETFYVNLSNQGNATISDTQGLGTINNDDGGALPSTITSCAGCHTYPPTDGTQRNTPAGAVVGSHSEHSANVCSSCHVAPATETSVDFKHRNSLIQFQGGVGYSRTASVAQTNDLDGAGLGYCSTATCHNAYGASGIQTTTWGQNVTCGACHAIAGDGAPNTGSHSRHMSLSGALCNQCHTGAVKDSDGGTAHVDNNIDVAYGSYPTNVIKHTSGSGYSTCSNIYCHSNVQDGTAGGGPTSYGTPTWGDTPPLACSTASCHGNPPATPTANSAHTAHSGGTEGYSIACSTSCHNNAGDETTSHANGTLNVTINATLYGGTYSQGDHAPGSGGYGSCSNVYCHGAFSGGLTASPAWNGTVACGSCHANTAASATSLRASHTRHAGSAAGQLNLLCTKCHPSRVVADGHVDSSVQWALATGDALFGTNARYNALISGATGTKAPSASYQTCTSLYCHSSVQSNPGTGAPASYATPTWGAASVTCASCHGQGTASASGQPSTGSHEVHVTTYAYACAVCHTGHGEDISTHANGTINLAFEAATAGGSATYTTKGTSFAPQSAAFQTCTTTFCHGDSTNTSADTGTWGTALSAADACTVCHGTKTTGADGSATAYLRAPGGNATGVDTNGTLGTPTRSVFADFELGAHDGHLRGVANISNAIACTECHDVPVVSVTGIKGHINDGTPANMTWGTLAKTNSTTPTFDTGTHTCSTVYCHDEGRFPTANHTNGGSDTTPTWNDTAYFGDNVPPLTSTECGRCHFYDASNCSSCHFVSSAGDFVNADNLSFAAGNKGLHINGAITAVVSCTGCHTGTQGTRRAITGEFGLAFGHHDNTVTDADCAVCHMEANSVADPTRSGSHAGVPGGNVDLRDPDLGTAIANPAAVFARNLSSNTLETFALSIQNDHCLKCHDSNGANYLGAGQTGTDGSHTPSNPFVTGVPPANVDDDFTTTNPSFHPVKGVQNNAYCDVDTMMTPWDVPNGTHKPITCFDCHAADGAAGNQTSTVVAHGTNQSDTVRGTDVATLCTSCHQSTIYWGANVHGAAAGSAWTSNTEGRHQPADHTSCQECHGGDTSYGGTDSQTQAQRAEAAHGFSDAGKFAFMRNAQVTFEWDTTNPRTFCRGNGTTAMCGYTGNGADGTADKGLYSPGGTY